MSYHSKAGSKKYTSRDGKYLFRSRHEALAYNIFDKEGILDQIESETYRFKKTCRKIPDFVWESKKIIIEIAGVNESLRKGYWENLETAKPCLEKQGYTVYIIDTRDRSPYRNYIRFYNHLCKLLGFTPKPEIKDDIYSYVGDPIDLIKRNQEITQYKKNNPEAGPTEIAKNLNVSYNTVKSVLTQAGLTTPRSLTPDQTQDRNQKIINFAEQNREAIKNQKITYQEIADKFSTPENKIHRDTIRYILKQAGFTTSLPLARDQYKIRDQEIIQYKKDNPDVKPNKIADKFNLPVTTIDNILKRNNLTSLTQRQTRNQEIIQYKKANPNAKYKEIADKFSTPKNKITPSAIANIFLRLKKSNPTNEQSTNNKTMTRNELREIIRKTLQENTTLTKDTIQKKYNEMFGKNPQTTFADVAKALNTTEQAIAMALMGGSLPMKEMGLYALKNPADSSKGLAQTIDPDDATEGSSAFKSKYKKVQ
jgi:transposase